MNDERAPADRAPTPEFEALYRAHHRRVERFVARRVPRDDVDDVVATTFAIAWRRVAELPSTESRRETWLTRTAQLVILNAHRSRRRGDALTDRIGEQLGPDDDVDPPAGTHELEGSLVDALMELTPEDRYLLIASVWEERTAAELAEALGCTPGAARTRLSRARARLRRLLHRTRHRS